MLMQSCREKERMSSGASKASSGSRGNRTPGSAVKVTPAAFEKRLVELIEPAVEKLAEVIKKAGADDLKPSIWSAARPASRRGQAGCPPFPKIKLFTTDKPLAPQPWVRHPQRRRPSGSMRYSPALRRHPVGRP